MLKKLLCATMAAAICVMPLAGCKNNESVNPETISETGYAPKKNLEITVWNTQGTDYAGKSLKKNIVEEWLVKKSRVKVENIYGNDGGQWDSKLSKLVAADDLPTIVSCGAFQGPSHFAKLDKLGKVWELTPEIIQKYAPELWRKTPAKFWENIKVDGKILGIPYYSDPNKECMPEATDEELATINNIFGTNYNDVTIEGFQCLWVRDDILKKFYPESKSYDELLKILEERNEPIGDELMDIPIKSTEEYISFMYNIKNADLKENGKTVHAFGYVGGDNWSALSWLGADMYGYKSHYYTGTWNDNKQRIEIPLAHDLIKQAAKTQNKMLADGVIDPESMAETVSQAKEKVLNGLYAIAPIGAIDDVVSINKTLEDTGKSFRYRPFYVQVPHQEDYGPYKEDRLWLESMCILKTASEEELHQILNWINIQYTDEFDQIKHWGPEEAGLYETDENGKRHFKDERFTKYFLDNDASALTPEETLGLSGPTVAGYKKGGLYTVSPSYLSRWDPKVQLNYVKYVPTANSGFKFPSDSEHVKVVKKYPPCQIWASIYAEIPEVVDFWAERGQWENQFRMAMAAPVNEFDEKWDKALIELNKIADIAVMEEKMTEIAKDYISKSK